MDDQVVEDAVAIGIVVVTKTFLPVLGTRLAGLGVHGDAPLVEFGVIELRGRLEGAEPGQAGQNCQCDLVFRFLDGIQEGDAVVGARERGAGGDPVFVAAFEQAGEFTGGSDRAFFFTAGCHHVDEAADGGAAVAVAHDVDLLQFALGIEFAPVRDNALVGAAVTVVAVLLGMGFTVVDRAADDLRVHFAAAVPHAGEAGDGRDVELFVILRGIVLDADVVVPAEVRDELVHEFVVAKPREAVEDHDGVVV